MYDLFSDKSLKQAIFFPYGQILALYRPDSDAGYAKNSEP
jgi:hypothetical protein